MSLALGVLTAGEVEGELPLVLVLTLRLANLLVGGERARRASMMSMDLAVLRSGGGAEARDCFFGSVSVSLALLEARGGREARAAAEEGDGWSAVKSSCGSSGRGEGVREASTWIRVFELAVFEDRCLVS